MLHNYLKITLRNLVRHKVYTAINVAGLALGICCSTLIMLYVLDELSYDSYLEHIDALYRINLNGRLAGQEIRTSTTCAPMAAALKQEFPEVVEATRIWEINEPALVTTGDGRLFNESQMLYADSTFFALFSIKIQHGDAATALNKPYSVVLTRSTAEKYFGQEDPIGRTLSFNQEDDYKVTAITEDVPHNTHFHYDLLASYVTLPASRRTFWISNNLNTYVRLQEKTVPQEFEAKLDLLVKKYVAPQIGQAIGVTFDEFVRAGGDYHYSIEPVRDIHLYSTVQDNLEPSSNPTYVYSFGIVAFIILILACINFMNLATARSANRAREVGVRKVVGSSKFQLIRQFLTEAIVLSLVASLIAILLVAVFLPHFNNVTKKSIPTGFWMSSDYLLFSIGLALLVGILAGSYPAFFLSAFRPVEVLKGKLRAGTTNSGFRRGLVVFQFSISIALLICTLVVGEQLDFIARKQLGFEKEHVLLVKRASALGDKLDSFQSELRRIPGILASAGTVHVPGHGEDGNGFQPEGADANEPYLLSTFTVGYDFVEALDMEVVSGRNFSRQFGSDSSAYIINEAAVRKFGWKEAVGKTIIEPDPEETITGLVIGVVKDFHFTSLHEPILPAILRLNPYARFVVVRMNGEALQSTIAEVQRLWESQVPGQPFEYSFLVDDFDALYESDRQASSLFATFSGLGIAIACLGLFGLASFAAEQRTKEIGVRKVLGASMSNIIVLLTKEFSGLVAFAFLLAVPVAYYGMSAWLQEFAYRTTIRATPILLSGLMAMAVAWLTVSYQSVRAASTNPARALKYE